LVDYQEEYQVGMARLNVGEAANFALIPAANAALEQLLAWKPEHVQEYCAALNAVLEQRLQHSLFTMPDKTSRAEHLFGISLPRAINVEALQAALTQANVFVSLRGDFIRVSPSVYNTGEDMNAFADVLLSLK
jgi:selenocysteine lyase/cysteine desulfurase